MSLICLRHRPQKMKQRWNQQVASRPVGLSASEMLPGSFSKASRSAVEVKKSSISSWLSAGACSRRNAFGLVPTSCCQVPTDSLANRRRQEDVAVEADEVPVVGIIGDRLDISLPLAHDRSPLDIRARPCFAPRTGTSAGGMWVTLPSGHVSCVQSPWPYSAVVLLEYTLKTAGAKFKYLAEMFGEELRKTRLRAGLTQQELADRAGLHYTYVCHLEHDRYSPTLDAFFRLCDALSVSPARLIGRIAKRRKEQA